MIRLIAVSFLCLVAITTAVNADDLAIAAKRIREAAGDEWRVDVCGREVVLELNRSVAFAYVELNAPARAPGEVEPPVETHNKVCRITLKFGERLSAERYEKLRHDNQAMQATRDALEAKVAHISHKFDSYLPSNAVERRELAEYRRDVAALMFHDLPDLYSPEHGIRLYRSWSWDEYIPDETERAVVGEAQQTLLRLFGVYDPLAAFNHTSLGRFLEPKDGRQRQ